jgi:predicted kinase
MEYTRRRRLLKTLYLLCGIPGSGKSTYINENLDTRREINISRDKVRFELLQPGDPYFAHEKEVWRIFVGRIKFALSMDAVEGIWVDATHLNVVSRRKILQELNLKGVRVIPIYFSIPVETAIARDAKREGRAHVGEKAIRNMYESFTPPTFGELSDLCEYYQIIEIHCKGD